MLYLFVGTDRDRIRSEAVALREGLLKRKPDATVIKFSADQFSVSEFESNIGGQGLFNAASVVYADGVLTNSETKEFFVKNVEAIARSQNVFIILEEKLDAATKKKIEPKAAKIVTHDKADSGRPFGLGGGSKISTREFNPFALGDALIMRDKQKLFSLLHDAYRHDLPPEEISGMLFASVRGMRIVGKVKTAGEADMKPYPFQKAKAGLSKWSEKDLENVSRAMVLLYHDAHRGLCDFVLGLEKLILTKV